MNIMQVSEKSINPVKRWVKHVSSVGNNEKKSSWIQFKQNEILVMVTGNRNFLHRATYYQIMVILQPFRNSAQATGIECSPHN